MIGMFGSISGGTEDSIAQIDIPQDGIIRAIEWSMLVNLDADGESSVAEISFIATNQLAQNDVRGRISSVGVGILAVLSAVGGHTGQVNTFNGPFELIVAGGERLFMHALSTAGVLGSIRTTLHFDGGAATTRRSQRR
jgi:hypothetical protein